MERSTMLSGTAAALGLSLLSLPACSMFGGPAEPGPGPAPPEEPAIAETMSAAVPPPAKDPLPATFNLPSAGASGGGAAAPPPPVPTVAGGTGTGSAAAARHVFWAIDEAEALVRIDERTPLSPSTLPVTGLRRGEHLVGIDFRPKDGKLFGVATGASGPRLYALDTASGAAKAVGPDLIVPLVGASFGFDFDPTADVARVTSDLGQNIALDPVTGWVANIDAALDYASDDANAGESAALVGAAFSPAGTALHAVDATRKVLTVVEDPGSGIVLTVGPLGIASTTARVRGFDIGSDGAAFAVVVDAGKSWLYAIDLATGRAGSPVKVAVTAPLKSLAIAP